MKKLVITLIITLISISSALAVTSSRGLLKIKAGPSTVLTPQGWIFQLATIAPGTGTLYELMAQTDSQFPMEPYFEVFALNIPNNCLSLRGPGDPVGHVPISPIDYDTLETYKDTTMKISWQDIGADEIYDTNDDVWPIPPTQTEGGENWYFCTGNERYPCYTPICTINCPSDNAKIHARIEADIITPIGRKALVFILKDAKTGADLDAYCMELDVQRPGAQLIVTWLSVILVPASIFSLLGLAKYLKWF